MRRTTLLLATALTLLATVVCGWAESALPVGTTITHSNWQQYQSHMSEYQRQMFQSDNQTCDVPAGATITIGPTQSYPLGRPYWDATEKYSKQVSLQKVPNGSYTIKGYVAGQPFPNLDPSDPLAGYKLMYDIYFQYYPAVRVTDNMQSFDIDRYGNTSFIHTLSTSYEIMHNVDPGYPQNVPVGIADLFYASSVMQNAPEQIKYQAALTLTWDTPESEPESYVFLPSIRRALRLSSAARCAPFQGQDFANDDVTPTPLPPTWFEAKYLGVQKQIAFLLPPDDRKLSLAAVRSSFYPGGAELFPKPEVLGKWQVRDEYVLQLRRLPQYAAGYCYGKKVMYLDKEFVGTMGWDDWDQNGKYWRGLEDLGPAIRLTTGGYYVWAPVLHTNCDFQNDHQSILMPPAVGRSAVWVDHETPQQFMNYQRYATPAGLQQILQ